MIPEFKSESELLQFAKVNGYNAKGTEKLLTEWKNSNKVEKNTDKSSYDTYSAEDGD